VHRAIYEAAATLIDAGKVADPRTIWQYLPPGAEKTKIGPITLKTYIGRLAAEATTVLCAGDYAEAVIELARRRDIIRTAEEIAAAAYDDVDPDLAEKAKSAFSDLAKAREKANPFGAVSLDEIQIADDPVHRIDGLLPAGPGLHVIYGPPKSLKSFGLMDAFMHIAAGLQYAGRTVAQGAVAYVTNEGIHGVERRLVGMRRHLRIEGCGVPFFLVPTMPNLGNDAGDAEKLIAAIAAVAPAGTPLVAIAIDTVRRAMPGKDENTTKDMSAFVANCGLIAQAFGCLVSGVHHSPRSDNDRGAGSNALDGAMDCGWSVARDGDKATVTVKIMKDGPEGESWVFVLVPVQVGTTRTGKPIMTCVVDIEQASSQAAKAQSKVREPGSVREFRAAFIEALDATGQSFVPRSGCPVVRAVELRIVRGEFERRHATGETDTRKRADAQRKAFIRAMKKLSGEFSTCVQEDQEWIWQIRS
jgi:hypothetical protein